MANIPVHGKTTITMTICSGATFTTKPHSKSELQVSEDEGKRPTTMAQNFSQRAANAVEKLWLVKEMVLHGGTKKKNKNAIFVFVFDVPFGTTSEPHNLKRTVAFVLIARCHFKVSRRVPFFYAF